jgi:hypothetical protein
MTSMVFLRTASSFVLIESPAGFKRSQCSPVTATPQSSAALRAAAICAAPMRCGSSESVYGAISRPS